MASGLFYLALLPWPMKIRRVGVGKGVVILGASKGHAEEDLRELVQIGRLPRHRLYPEAALTCPLALPLTTHGTSPVLGSRPA